MASNILQHVKYKNQPTKTVAIPNTVVPQKKVLLVKKPSVQTIAHDIEKCKEASRVHKGTDAIGKDQKSIPTTTTKSIRTTKGANPNKDIIKRANKGFNRTFKSLEELGDLLPDDTQ